MERRALKKSALLIVRPKIFLYDMRVVKFNRPITQGQRKGRLKPLKSLLTDLVTPRDSVGEDRRDGHTGSIARRDVR